MAKTPSEKASMREVSEDIDDAGQISKHCRRGFASLIYQMTSFNLPPWLNKNLDVNPMRDFHDVLIRTSPRCRTFMTKFLGGVIPVQTRDFEIAFLVAVGFAVIRVQTELAVRSGINQHPFNLLFLICTLNF